MTNEEKHDIALTASKYYVEANLSQYFKNRNGYQLLVSDLLVNYKHARMEIDKTLPHT